MPVTIAGMMSGCHNTVSLLTRYALIQLVLLVGNSTWSIWTERQVNGMTELKPCPFCGGEAELNLLLGNYCVTCKSCMGAIFPAAGMTEEEAIELWNRRAGEKSE